MQEESACLLCPRSTVMALQWRNQVLSSTLILRCQKGAVSVPDRTSYLNRGRVRTRGRRLGGICIRQPTGPSRRPLDSVTGMMTLKAQGRRRAAWCRLQDTTWLPWFRSAAGRRMSTFVKTCYDKQFLRLYATYSVTVERQASCVAHAVLLPGLPGDDTTPMQTEWRLSEAQMAYRRIPARRCFGVTSGSCYGDHLQPGWGS